MTGRTIVRVVPPTQSGPITRLIGTVDIDGSGTNHSLDQCDPFMLLDYAVVPKSNLPPFGAHPHRGHSVVSILLQGKVKSWDSFHPNDEPTVLEGPAAYWVDAASGLFHDETSLVEDPSNPAQHVEMFQLWISVKEEDRSNVPASQHDANLPVTVAMDEDGNVIGSTRYFVGGGGTIKTPHPIIVSHITQKAGTTLKIPIDPAHGGGFVAHIKGSAVYGDTKDATTECNTVHVLAEAAMNAESSESSYLQVTTTPNNDDQIGEDTHYLFCVGEIIKEPWCKKLVASGAVIAKSEEEAREIASCVEIYSKEGLSSSGNFAPFGIVPAAEVERLAKVERLLSRPTQIFQSRTEEHWANHQ